MELAEFTSCDSVASREDFLTIIFFSGKSKRETYIGYCAAVPKKYVRLFCPCFSLAPNKFQALMASTTTETEGSRLP